jgi:hypothetical protein
LIHLNVWWRTDLQTLKGFLFCLTVTLRKHHIPYS